MDTTHRSDYKRSGYLFVECLRCGERFNAGRGGNSSGIRYCMALKNDWWARHTGQPSPEVVHVCDDDVKLCSKLELEVR